MTPVVLRSCSFLLRGVVKISQSTSSPTLLKCIHPNIYVNTNPNHSLRKLSVRTSVHDDMEEQEFYSEYDLTSETVANRSRAISNMQTIFDISPKRAQTMVRKYPELKFVGLKSAQCNVQFLNDEGISMGTLKENPWLLTYKIETLSSKLEILKKLHLGDVNTILPLLQITLLRLKEHSATEERESESIPHGNRIKYTCEKLKCGLAEACKVFVEYEFLYTIPFQRYSDVMETLLDAGVSPSHILRDVWVFRYSITTMKTRLAILKEVGIKPIKPWMLRSSPETFAVTIQREVSRKEVLGENSVEDYLTQQLQCDEKTVEHISSKYPSILRIHVSKLKELFDFLFTEGYAPQQVLHVPRILFHSVDTIKFRALELKDAGYSPTTLMTLCKSKREFEKILETARKRKYKNTS